ncbi:MAG: hypothetical protein IKK99_07905 [Oscillospiraceae bacterium]|nr:hypothetical protein [Oscillospiraceae bacterium]
MAEKKQRRVTESEKRRHRKAVKRNRFLAKLGIFALVVCLVVFGVNKFISSRYQTGEQIDNDIKLPMT